MAKGSNMAIVFAIVVRLVRRLVGFVRVIRKVVPHIARTLAGCFTLGRGDVFSSLVIIHLVPWQEEIHH